MCWDFLAYRQWVLPASLAKGVFDYAQQAVYANAYRNLPRAQQACIFLSIVYMSARMPSSSNVIAISPLSWRGHDYT
jgi:hypothetical protein